MTFDAPRRACAKCGQVHERRPGGPPTCTGHTSSRDDRGRPCGNYPLRGATVCIRHGARAPQVKAAAGRQVARSEVVKEMAKLGVPIDTDPLDALLDMVSEAAGNVAYLRPRVQDVDSTHAVYDRAGKPYTNPVLGFYNEERDRLARYSKMALDAGVDERLLKVAQAVTVFQADALAEEFEGAMVDAGIGQEGQEAMRVALAARLRLRMEA